MKNLLAQGLQIAPNGGFTGIGKLGQKSNLGTNSFLTFTGFISTLIGVMTIIAFIWFVFLFITGAISYMTAGEDKQAVEGARKKITNGVVGLVIVIVSLFAIQLIGYLIGIPDILNLVSLLNNLL